MPHDPLSELKRLVRCGHTGPIKLGPMSSTVLVRGMLPWECVAPEDLTLTMADDLWFARIVCAPNGMQHLMRDPSRVAAIQLARRRVTVSRFSPPVDDEYRWLVP